MTNPFFAPSPLPHGLPDFAAIADADYAEAFERGIADHEREIEAIVSNPAPPTFENTLVALESSGAILQRVAEVFFAVASADATESIQRIEETWAPRLSAHTDRIVLNGTLYARVAAVRETMGSSAEGDRTAEQRYLVERWHTEMTLAGAALDAEAKGRLATINDRISELTTKFDQLLLADANELAVVLDSAAELDGLGDAEISAAAAAATERGLDGKYLVSLVLPTGHPWLAQLTDFEVRGRIMWASRERGAHGGEHDTRATLLEIVRLRAQRARILGFPSHAAAITADETAGTPEAVAEMLGRLAPAAAANARAEQAALVRQSGEGWLRAADWSYWTERVRAAEYDIDTAALRPWFEAERVLRDGVFWAATQLYGVTFTLRPELVGWKPDVRVYEVKDEDGTPVGLYLLDLYARPTKRGGAWMNSITTAAKLLGIDTVVVTNNLNVPKPAAGEPTLLTFDEVGTLFHEFGHALHGLFARATYPKFSGTTYQRDFVEFPSQVNEMWMLWPEVLEHYAKHYVTGEPIDAGVVERIADSTTFNQGFLTSEYLAAALLDQAWHTLSPEGAESVTDVNEFERAALARVGLDNPVVPSRYQTSYFQHVFASGYDARYYGYIWSEVLDADTVEWFKEHGGLTRENGQRFRERLLGVGGSKDPLEAYRDFRGRDAEIGPLLARRGLEG